jgi:hypothetical protein
MQIERFGPMPSAESLALAEVSSRLRAAIAPIAALINIKPAVRLQPPAATSFQIENVGQTSRRWSSSPIFFGSK